MHHMCTVAAITPQVAGNLYPSEPYPCKPAREALMWSVPCLLFRLHAALGKCQWSVTMHKNGMCRYVQHQIPIVLKHL